MLVSFFESIKYVGHLFPLAFLRVYVGYYYINQAIGRYYSDFLDQPRLAEEALHWLPRSVAPQWYKELIEAVVVPHWQVFATSITTAELLVGFSFVLGYLVRPFSLVGIILSLCLLWTLGPEMSVLYKTFIAIHITLGWVGAGRCLGIDYFFYKRHRGVWW